MLTLENAEENFKIHKLFIFVLGITLLAQNLWIPGFFQDGYLYAAFGKNASELGHWLVPHLSQSTYAEFSQHVPFIFILEGLVFKLFGASYITARIFGIIPVFLCAWMIHRFFKKHELSYWTLLFYFLTFPLIKKSRFPNLDTYFMLFNFLVIYFVYLAKTRFQLNWILSGLFLGLCFLTKGPIGILTLFSVFVILISEKRISELKRMTPWFSLILGFGLFALWPLSLNLAGQFEIFEKWYHQIFIHTIKDARGEQTFSFFVYFAFLIKSAGIQSIILLFGIYKFRKKWNNLEEFSRYAFICFWCFLIPLSFATFKYSHYILPIYPMLAIFCGNVVYSLNNEIQKAKFIKYFSILCLLTPLILLSFPLTNKVKRDSVIHKVQSLGFKNERNWAIVDEAYPFFALANKIGFDEYGEVFPLTLDQLNSSMTQEAFFIEREGKQFDILSKPLIVLVPTNRLSLLQSNDRYFEIFRLKDKNLSFLVDKSLYSSQTGTLVE